MRRTRPVLALALIATLTLAASPVAAKGPLSSETTEKVRDFVTSAFDELGVAGAAVVIVSAEGIVFAEGFGAARDDGTPATPQTPFHVASLSKQLTGIAVMQLVASGDLRLEATVRDYLPWFGADGSQTAQITVRDLLAHTSGFSTAQAFVNRSEGSTDDGALERWVRRVADIEPANPIGHFEYHNVNYDVLGYLVAAVSGESYESYLTEHVLRPLQMNHTHLDEADAEADGLAQGHYPFFGMPISYEIVFERSSVPSAFVMASAEDLGHVLIAHLNGGQFGDTRVLSAAAMAELHQPLVHPNPWDGYGWGWWSYPLWDAGLLVDGSEFSNYEVPVLLAHDGSHITYASSLALLPEEELGVVVLMNLNDELAPSRFYQLHTSIAQILLGRDVAALTSYDDVLAQYGKLIGVGWVAVLALLIAWSARRYRRWQRDRGSIPRTRGQILRRMVAPMAIIVGLMLGFWWLLLTRAQESLLNFPAIVESAPDIGLLAVTVALLGIGWALIGTIWTVRLLRRGTPATSTA